MTASAIPARSSGPAARLRAATTPVHRAAEAEPFIVSLMSGGRSIDAYRTLLAQLLPVYTTLETLVEVARREAPVVIVPLFDARLDRASAIAHDLAALPADRTPADAGIDPETDAYVARLTAIGGDWRRLLAHHYVRYLGDLSGGQIIAEMLRRHYGLPDDALTFYAFDGLGSKGTFKTRYREGMDAALADPSTYEVVLDEALRAYEANRLVFAALGRAGI